MKQIIEVELGDKSLIRIKKRSREECGQLLRLKGKIPDNCTIAFTSDDYTFRCSEQYTGEDIVIPDELFTGKQFWVLISVKTTVSHMTLYKIVIPVESRRINYRRNKDEKYLR